MSLYLNWYLPLEVTTSSKTINTMKLNIEKAKEEERRWYLLNKSFVNSYNAFPITTLTSLKEGKVHKLIFKLLNEVFRLY